MTLSFHLFFLFYFIILSISKFDLFKSKKEKEEKKNIEESGYKEYLDLIKQIDLHDILSSNYSSTIKQERENRKNFTDIFSPLHDIDSLVSDMQTTTRDAKVVAYSVGNLLKESAKDIYANINKLRKSAASSIKDVRGTYEKKIESIQKTANSLIRNNARDSISATRQLEEQEKRSINGIRFNSNELKKGLYSNKNTLEDLENSINNNNDNIKGKLKENVLKENELLNLDLVKELKELNIQLLGFKETKNEIEKRINKKREVDMNQNIGLLDSTASSLSSVFNKVFSNLYKSIKKKDKDINKSLNDINKNGKYNNNISLQIIKDTENNNNKDNNIVKEKSLNAIDDIKKTSKDEEIIINKIKEIKTNSFNKEFNNLLKEEKRNNNNKTFLSINSFKNEAENKSISIKNEIFSNLKEEESRVIKEEEKGKKEIQEIKNNFDIMTERENLQLENINNNIKLKTEEFLPSIDSTKRIKLKQKIKKENNEQMSDIKSTIKKEKEIQNKIINQITLPLNEFNTVNELMDKKLEGVNIMTNSLVNQSTENKDKVLNAINKNNNILHEITNDLSKESASIRDIYLSDDYNNQNVERMLQQMAINIPQVPYNNYNLNNNNHFNLNNLNKDILINRYKINGIKDKKEEKENEMNSIISRDISEEGILEAKKEKDLEININTAIDKIRKNAKESEENSHLVISSVSSSLELNHLNKNKNPNENPNELKRKVEEEIEKESRNINKIKNKKIGVLESIMKSGDSATTSIIKEIEKSLSSLSSIKETNNNNNNNLNLNDLNEIENKENKENKEKSIEIAHLNKYLSRIIFASDNKIELIKGNLTIAIKKLENILKNKEKELIESVVYNYGKIENFISNMKRIMKLDSIKKENIILKDNKMISNGIKKEENVMESTNKDEKNRLSSTEKEKIKRIKSMDGILKNTLSASSSLEKSGTEFLQFLSGELKSIVNVENRNRNKGVNELIDFRQIISNNSKKKDEEMNSFIIEGSRAEEMREKEMTDRISLLKETVNPLKRETLERAKEESMNLSSDSQVLSHYQVIGGNELKRLLHLAHLNTEDYLNGISNERLKSMSRLSSVKDVTHTFIAVTEQVIRKISLTMNQLQDTLTSLDTTTSTAIRESRSVVIEVIQRISSALSLLVAIIRDQEWTTESLESEMKKNVVDLQRNNINLIMEEDTDSRLMGDELEASAQYIMNKRNKDKEILKEMFNQFVTSLKREGWDS